MAANGRECEVIVTLRELRKEAKDRSMQGQFDARLCGELVNAIDAAFRAFENQNGQFRQSLSDVFTLAARIGVQFVFPD